MRNRRPLSGAVWKGIIIAEIIICYLAFLTVVSYIRGPERYRTVTDTPLLRSEEFISFAGAPAGTGGGLRLENTASGAAVGYMARLRLTGLEQIYISFQMECPAEFAGGTLVIDLYNSEAEYDNPEQEYRLTIQEGHSEVECQLTPGESPPEEAFLRVFTLDHAGYQLEEIRICRMELLPRVPVGLWVGVGVCYLALAGTGIVWMVNRKNRRGGSV